MLISSSDRDGQVTFLEVNVAPGCTETSLLPQAVDAAGLDLGHVFQVLVERAMGAASVLSRPGHGGARWMSDRSW